jgi:hypothetical protein
MERADRTRFLGPGLDLAGSRRLYCGSDAACRSTGRLRNKLPPRVMPSERDQLFSSLLAGPSICVDLTRLFAVIAVIGRAWEGHGKMEGAAREGEEPQRSRVDSFRALAGRRLAPRVVARILGLGWPPALEVLRSLSRD